MVGHRFFGHEDVMSGNIPRRTVFASKAVANLRDSSQSKSEENMTKRISSILAGVAMAAVFAVSAANAETMTFKADLKGASEVPPTASTGTGTVEATYDTASKKLSWKGSVSGLTANATAAHFHGPAEMGKNAGVMVPAPGVTNGPFEGSATLTDDQAKALLAGETYFNVHTPTNPGGEIRGQVMKAK